MKTLSVKCPYPRNGLAEVSSMYMNHNESSLIYFFSSWTLLESAVALPISDSLT